MLTSVRVTDVDKCEVTGVDKCEVTGVDLCTYVCTVPVPASETVFLFTCCV